MICRKKKKKKVLQSKYVQIPENLKKVVFFLKKSVWNKLFEVLLEIIFKLKAS